MTKKEQTLVQLIKERAITLDWNVSFNGKSFGNRHLERVQKIATHLQQAEGGDEFIVAAGAWVHDVSLASGNDNDSNLVRNETRKFLLQFNLEENLADEISEAVACHEGDIDALTIEAKIIHDADAIDKAGILGVIRHIWKTTNLIKMRILDSKQDLIELRNHLEARDQKIYTKSGRKLMNSLNSTLASFWDNEDTMTFMKLVSKAAMEGEISDEIAKKMILSTPTHSEAISNQLQCKYLSTS